MANIKWSDQALCNLKQIFEFIAQDSSHFAKFTSDRIIELIEKLEVFPEIGRKIPELNDPKVKELVYKNYRIIYQIRAEYLEIITIIHTSRILNYNNEFPAKTN